MFDHRALVWLETESLWRMNEAPTDDELPKAEMPKLANVPVVVIRACSVRPTSVVPTPGRAAPAVPKNGEAGLSSVTIRSSSWGLWARAAEARPATETRPKRTDFFTCFSFFLPRFSETVAERFATRRWSINHAVSLSTNVTKKAACSAIKELLRHKS
jgi:hypothetical protein